MLNRKKFIENHFITCDECGYNNHKDRFQAYGTCLHCGKVLDDRVMFKVMLRKIALKNPHLRSKNRTRAILYF